MGVVTSGYLLTEAVINRLVNSGITNLSISLDYPTSVQHDAQRGRTGMFDRIAGAINELSRLRKNGRDAPSVGINCILMAQNLNYIAELASIISDWDITEILFQPIQPDFAGDSPSSLSHFRNWLPADLERVDSALDAVEDLRGTVPLGQTREEFNLIKRYFRNPMHLPPGSCQSALRNLMVDVSGFVTHCFGQARTGIKPLGRLPEDNVVDLWKSAKAQIERELLAKCSFGCGALLCHSRSSVPMLTAAHAVA
jgi:MoaA/NifB/PqqE/SkfB family radical SAM enzyme